MLVLPFLGSFASAFILNTTSRDLPVFVAGRQTLVTLVLTASTYPFVMHNGVLRFTAEWLPQFGLDFLFG